jgi:hypothetical protein
MSDPQNQPKIHVTKETIIRGPGRQTKYPFGTMGIGDVFYLYRDRDGRIPSKTTNTIYSSKRYWENKLEGRKFDIHTVSVGLRIQRVE